MFERMINGLGPAYILWMMIATRLCGLVGGALVVYYVSLTLDLSPTLQFHWGVIASVVVLVSVSLTVLLALAETRALRSVLASLRLGASFSKELGRAAGLEAVVFSIRHHQRELVVVPLCCLPPVYVYLPWAAGANSLVLLHITIAALMGVVTAVGIAYFVIDRLMRPVVLHLVNYGVEIDYERIPVSRLFNQLVTSFVATVVITATMIATMATQKASNLISVPGQLDDIVSSLRFQTIAISACAVGMAVVVSLFVARSVSVPVGELLSTMKRVESGDLSQRIAAISTNEIGVLGRSFNRMVQQIEKHQNDIRDLNANLEQKVHERTRQLETSREEIQNRNSDLEVALKELRRAQERLVHSEKLTSLGELAAGIAHEINNSINAVCNGIIPLRQKVEKIAVLALESLTPGISTPAPAGAPDAQRLRDSFASILKLASVVETGAKRTADIVSDLRRFAHPGHGDRAPFDVHEGLDLSLSLLSGKLKNRITVQRNYCGDGVISCCGNQLSQVLMNILDNSQQAISGTGNIWISTCREAEQLVIRVRDDGCGIPNSIRTRVFDPFFTTKPVGVGTGLGLSISYGIVRGHGGTIDIFSPPSGFDRGTEFVISLPLVADRVEESLQGRVSLPSTANG